MRPGQSGQRRDKHTPTGEGRGGETIFPSYRPRIRLEGITTSRAEPPYTSIPLELREEKDTAKTTNAGRWTKDQSEGGPPSDLRDVANPPPDVGSPRGSGFVLHVH